MNAALMSREDEGGSPLAFPGLESVARPLLGTVAQIEWAESIRIRVNDEFDRVAASLQSVAHRQSASQRGVTEAIITILEEKRVEVLSREQAGYFIRDWQEISDQVRRMVGQDSRYQAIRAEKAAQSSVNRGK